MVLLFILLAENKISMQLCRLFSSSGVAFGVVNSFAKTFFIYDFEELMFNSSMGGIRIINGEMLVGISEIAKRNPDFARYLSGGILLSFFAFGIALNFKKNRASIAVITLVMLATGNTTMFSLMLLITLPLFFLYIIFSFFSYLLSGIFDLNFIFSKSQSVIEAVVINENRLYLIILGVFLAAVAYYVSRIVLESEM